MTTSDFPYGATSMGQLVIGIPTQGNTYWVDPSKGSDSFDGLTPQTAFKSLLQAHTTATANQNDIVYLLSSTNAATPTTNRVAAGGLTWSKDGVHLIGVSSGNHCQQRARISPATTDVTTNTVLTVSANNCLFKDFSVFHGVDGWTGAGGGVPTAVQVTGQRNRFQNVTMSGLGDATSANSMDVANGSSLWLSGAAENLFEDCYIGLDTVSLGNTTASALRLTGAQTLQRNLFRNCVFATRASHVNHAQVQVGASALQSANWFVGCTFSNSGVIDGAVTSDGVFKVGATQNGLILVQNCGTVGFSFWEKATVSGNVFVVNPAIGAGKAGLGTVAVGS